MAGRDGFSIVVADGGGDDAAIVAVESLDVAVEREILAMFVMAAMADHVADVVEHCGSLEQNARMRGQVMHRLQLIEEHDAELAYVLGMLLVVFQSARKCASAEQDLPLGGVVAMRLFARKRLARNFLQQAFADADAGNREGAKIQITPDHDEDDRGDADDVGTIPPYGIRLHALADIAFENSAQAFAQQRKLQSRYAVFARAGSDRCECLRAAA